MKEACSPMRTPSKLSESLFRRLDLYALASTAAGVSLFARTQPAEAKIVYTKTHQVIGPNGIYALDLNHDGIVDYIILQSWAYFPVGSCGLNQFAAKGALGNAVEGGITTNNAFHTVRYYAPALKPGAQIGLGVGFVNGGKNGEAMVSYMQCTDGAGPYTYGQWINVNQRYLGLKFKIGGKTHYGWARLNARVANGQITGTLTGYAYETVANLPLKAGQTKSREVAGTDNSAVRHDEPPGTPLGALAQGVQSATFRRQP